MTPLNKAISRRANHAKDGGRRVIVTLFPGDVIGFRLERQRKSFKLPILACYHAAVKAELGVQRAAKKRRKKA